MSDIALIVFSGICTFVAPPPPGTDAPIPSRIIFNRTATTPNGIPVHQTFLVGSEDVEITDSRGQHVTGTAYSELGKRYTYFVIDGEYLTYESENTPPLGVPKPRTVESSPQSATESKLLDWIPKMHQVWPRWFSARGHTPLKSWLQHDPRFVAAVMPLPAGDLYVSHITGEIWQMMPGRMFHHRVKQSEAQEVTLEVRPHPGAAGTPAPLIIHAYNLNCLGLGQTPTDESCATGTFYIKLVPDANGQYPPNLHVSVMIGTMPLTDVAPGLSPCGGGTASTATSCESLADPCPATCIDRHFPLYYSAIYGANPVFTPMPHRIKSAAPPFPTANRVGSTNCPPTMLIVDETVP